MRLWVGIALVWWGLPSAWAQAPLKVVGDDAFPPYSQRVNGQNQGIDVDLMREAARRAGVSVDIELMPFKRVIESLRSGRADAGIAVLRNDEREAFLWYSGVLHDSVYVLFHRKGSEFAYTGLESLRGKQIGSVRGTYLGTPFAQAVQEGWITLQEVAAPDQGLKMLTMGRIDAVIGQSVVTRHLLRELGLADAVVSSGQPAAPNRPSFLVFSKAAFAGERPAMVERFTQVLDAMRRDGTVGRIEAQHLR